MGAKHPAGAQLDFGIEYNGRRGLWVGIDVSLVFRFGRLDGNGYPMSRAVH